MNALSPVTIYVLCGVALVGLGLWGAIALGHLLRKVMALNIMGTGIFMLAIALAKRAPGAPDPVPHAMVLTGIVVAISATAMGLVLIRRIVQETGQANLPEAHRETEDGHGH